MLLVKVQAFKKPLAPSQRTPPPLQLYPVLLIKVLLFKKPLAPLQLIPPPPIAALLIKLQLVNVPLAPDQKTAPPLPFWKLKFQKYKTMLLIG